MNDFQIFVSKVNAMATQIGLDMKGVIANIAAIINDAQASAASTFSSTKITNLLSGKVDKVTGKVLSDENYTSAEKTKLAGLESSKFLGSYPSLSALQTAHASASAGNYADVDALGSDAVRYIWDVTDTQWVAGGEGTALTAAQVKQLYESNPDTNPFEDADVAKLNGIEAGAQVNTVGSVNGKTGNLVTITKADVGLSLVENFAPATQAQAENATANDKYMTPLRTKQEIDALTGSVDPLASYQTALNS